MQKEKSTSRGAKILTVAFLSLLLPLAIALQSGVQNAPGPEQDSSPETAEPNSAQKSSGSLAQDDVVVSHAQEADESIRGMVMTAEMAEALEANHRASFVSNYREMSRRRGFIDQAPKLIHKRSGTLGLFTTPVAFVLSRFSTQTSEGEAYLSYIIVYGIIEDSLHTVSCLDLSGNREGLMTSPQCQEKLSSVFQEK